MSTNPLVSVILTSYNYADYIAESISSVLNQSYPNLELIIVDDGSTDDSQDIIKKTIIDASVDVTTVFKENAGQASAMNDGYAKVTGEIVCFLDSDDFWYEDKIHQAVHFMQQFPDGGVYQHQLNTSNGPKRGAMMSADFFQLWKEWGDGVFNMADNSVGLLFSPFVPTSGLMFKRFILNNIFPIPDAVITCPDAYLTRTAAAYGPVYSLPTCLGVWRKHDANAGSLEEYSFSDFWLPVVMPALNNFYKEHDLGLTLIHDRDLRSIDPAERILGQYYSSQEKNSGRSLRQQVEHVRPSPEHPVGRFSRRFLSESIIRSLRRIIGRNR